MFDNFTFTEREDGSIEYSGLLSPLQAQVIKHFDVELKESVFQSLEESMYRPYEDRVFAEAYSFAQKMALQGEDIPNAAAPNGKQDTIDWYLSHSDYAGSAADRERVNLEKKAELKDKIAELSGG